MRTADSNLHNFRIDEVGHVVSLPDLWQSVVLLLGVLEVPRFC